MTTTVTPHRRASDRPVSTLVFVSVVLLVVLLAAGFVILALAGVSTAQYAVFISSAGALATALISALLKVDKLSQQVDGVRADLSPDRLSPRIGQAIHDVVADLGLEPPAPAEPVPAPTPEPEPEPTTAEVLAEIRTLTNIVTKELLP
jgi:hypothetical protein